MAVDDVLDPESVASFWASVLMNCDIRLVVLHPRLDVVVLRNSGRAKQVADHHVRNQHAAVARWPMSFRVDSSDLSIEETLARASRILELSILQDALRDNGVNQALQPTNRRAKVEFSSR